MKAVLSAGPGGPEVLEYGDTPDPEPGPGEVVLDVAATAVNRADLAQRQGFYPPPEGASEILGLECSGTVGELGQGVEGVTVGQQVCALLAGGGYATKVAVPVGQVMPLPAGVGLTTAAALPEVAATVWSNVMMVAGLRSGDTFLVHGGAGGIGTFAIQLTKALGATVVATAGSEDKLALCRELGADVAINYREQDFVEVLADATGGHGADVILDNMGASYLARNLAALAIEGRLIVIGFQGGSRAEMDLRTLFHKRAALFSASLRARPVGEKTTICAAVAEHVWPLVADGTVKPVVGLTLPLAEAAEAHRLLENGETTGKILLTA
ncbi:MAG TPA: NAD(P)H-quinone oxidoreductase [Nocardioides sp.]|nr:NAD(P)H-quinone oxidoreductase [Nocardioides sp.]